MLHQMTQRAKIYYIYVSALLIMLSMVDLKKTPHNSEPIIF